MSVGPTNLVVIMSDEHDARFTGAAGHPIVRTPNIDRIAAAGRHFRSAYTPSPICVPARAAIATGDYVHRIRYWDNAIAYDGAVPSWGHRLQEAGVRVESIGKLHYRNASLPTGFDRQHTPMHLAGGQGMVWGSIRDPLPAIDRAGKPRMLGPRIGAGETDYTRYDREVVRLTKDWLDRAGTAPDRHPWVLFVGFVAPHFPLVAPDAFARLYPLDCVPAFKLRPEAGYRRHPWVQAMHDFWPHDDDLEDDTERRRAVAMYMALCSFLDANVGEIMDVIERTGLGDTTRVIYTSDHGDNLGARGMWGKSTLYQESVAVPLMLTGPNIAPETVEAPVSLLDLHPTILEGAGLETEATKPGVSLLNGRHDPDRAVFSEYHAVASPSAGYMVRKGRWKYHAYVGYAPELFDLEADPEELTDLAPDPAFAGTVAAMDRELRAICDPEAVDRAAKADQAALVASVGGRSQALDLGNIGATPPPDAT